MSSEQRAANIHGNVMIEVDVVRSIIARHMSPPVETGGQLYRKCTNCDDGIVQISTGRAGCTVCWGSTYVPVQHTKPALDQAGLVERMAEAIEQQFDLGYTATAIDFATVALAAVEAAGWGPRPEAVTEDELDEMREAAWMSARTDGAMWKAVVDAVLAALPERHRAIVLGSRGITVEGA